MCTDQDRAGRGCGSRAGLERGGIRDATTPYQRNPYTPWAQGKDTAAPEGDLAERVWRQLEEFAGSRWWCRASGRLGDRRPNQDTDELCKWFLEREDGTAMTRHDIDVSTGELALGGSIWTPDDRASAALILMYPGSGPSDRDNDVFFPPIRDALLATGAAVASFDKRGVGSSTGDWLTAGIEDQAADLGAFLARAREIVVGVPVGLFGHSQGGWVVLEASRSVSPDFVITSSGPSVTPRVQEEYSTRSRIGTLALGDAHAASVLELYGELFDRMSAGHSWDQASAWMDARAADFALLESVGAFVPDGPELWSFARLIIDYDPAPALAALAVPLLAVLGSADTVVPVEAAVDAYRRTVRPELLSLHVVEGGDHRIQDPESEELMGEYLGLVAGFVVARSAAP